MEVTFHNVRITLSGVGGPKEAYDRLCNALGAMHDDQADRVVDWHTDTYQCEQEEPRSTVEIFPVEGEHAIMVRQD